MTKQKFEEIYRKHYPEMYRLARTILYDEDESKDAVSEVFTKLLRADIEPQEDKLQGYLMTSVRNKCRDVLRHKSVRQRVENLYAADAKQDMTTATSDDERLERINEFVKRELSPLSQQILQLRFLGEMKYEEVAEAAGGAEATKDCYNYNRSISLLLTYNFNSTRNKYKGTGAGNEERRRL